MTDVVFTVRGIPVPQGSVRAFLAGGKARVATKSAPLMAWRTAIATAASTAMGDGAILDEPLMVRATFRLLRPSSAPKRVKLPAGRPDVDKMARALLDGMTGIVFRDDARVVDLWVQKKYADDEHPPGVFVSVSEARP